MNDPKTKRIFLKIFKAAIWGGLIFGGFTLSVGFCDKYFAKDITFSTLLVGYPSDTLVRCFGLDHHPFSVILGIMNGYFFAAIINALLGAFVFAAVTVLLQFIMKGSDENLITIAKGENPMKNQVPKKNHPVFKATIIGGLLFAGITLAVVIADHFWKGTSGEPGPNSFLGLLFLLDIPTAWLNHFTGWDQTSANSFPNSTAFAIIVNGFLGAVIFSFIASLWQSNVKDTHENKS